MFKLISFLVCFTCSACLISFFTVAYRVRICECFSRNNWIAWTKRKLVKKRGTNSYNKNKIYENSMLWQTHMYTQYTQQQWCGSLIDWAGAVTEWNEVEILHKAPILTSGQKWKKQTIQWSWLHWLQIQNTTIQSNIVSYLISNNRFVCDSFIFCSIIKKKTIVKKWFQVEPQLIFVLINIGLVSV